MASPFGIRFFTRGYEKTSREMSSIEHKAKGINTGFVRMGKTISGSGPLAARGFGVLKSGISGAAGAMKMFLGLTLRVTAALGVVGGVAAGVGIALATKFAKGLMATRETFYLIETALTGVVKNAGQVRKISDWAMKYAATYPAMYSDVMDAMKGLAMMPALKPIFTSASVKDMEKIMNITQSLAALDPQQGVKGALLAMREALAGQWRTLQYRFEIRPQAVASAAGLTMEELKTMPDKAIEALDAFTKLNVGADTLRKTALSLGTQWGNLSDKYEMWLDQVARYGAYKKLVSFLVNMNEVWDNLLESEAATKLGQDISRVLEAAIAGIETAITGVDWEEKGIFGGLLEAAKAIIKKIGNIFTDSKEFLAASLEVALVYIKNALIFSIKKIFWPVGVEIAKTIGDAFMAAIQKHPVQAWLGAMVTGGMVAGPKGALVAGGAAAVGLAGMEVQRRQPARAETVQKEITQLEKEMQHPERMNFWKAGGYEEALKRLPKLKNELIELKEIAKQTDATPFGGKFLADTEAAIEKAKTKWIEFRGTIEEKVGPRKAAPEITSVEEQMKNIIKAKIDLRSKELTATKEQVEVSRNNLAHLERMLEYHKKIVAWEADPKRGGTQERLKVEIKETEDFMTQFLKGRTKEEMASGKIILTIEPVIKGLAEKRKELEQLTKQFETDVGTVPARHTGAELEAKAMETLEKQKELKAAILETEQKIAILKASGNENANQLIALEVQLFNLVSQRLTAEEQIDEISKKQKTNAEKIAELRKTGGVDLGMIADLEKESIDLSGAKLKAEQQIAGAIENQKSIKEKMLSLETQIVEKSREGVKVEKESTKEIEKQGDARVVSRPFRFEPGLPKYQQALSHFKTFADSIGGLTGTVTKMRIPGGGTWAEGIQKSKGESTAGIPKFMLTMEAKIREKLTEVTSLEAKKSLLQSLYSLNVEQFQMATSPSAKGAQFQEANQIMEHMLNVEVAHYEQQDAMMKQSNELTQRLLGLAGMGISYLSHLPKMASGWPEPMVIHNIPPVPSEMADLGTSKINKNNPRTMPGI